MSGPVKMQVKKSFKAEVLVSGYTTTINGIPTHELSYVASESYGYEYLYMDSSNGWFIKTDNEGKVSKIAIPLEMLEEAFDEGMIITPDPQLPLETEE